MGIYISILENLLEYSIHDMKITINNLWEWCSGISPWNSDGPAGRVIVVIVDSTAWSKFMKLMKYALIDLD